MRILGNNIDVASAVKTAQAAKTVDNAAQQGSSGSATSASAKVTAPQVEKRMVATPLENSEELKQKIQEAVHTMNELLETNYSSSKFVYHEGLDRYYVSVIDRDTEEVVKEIPPKQLLDAFYEMQKMAGMIVDEKI